MSDIFHIEDLVRVAKRENNNKRAYLYVNPLQGKHIPANPIVFKRLCRQLAAQINNRYPADRILVIGFAETATAIALETAMSLDNAVYVECTTREDNESSEFSYFTESHSHATEQRIDTKNYKDIVRNVDRVVFVEDEVTTGNTIMKLVNILKSNFDGGLAAFTISSILNSMSRERENALAGLGIECIYVAKLPFEYNIETINGVAGCNDTLWNDEGRPECNIVVRNINVNINQRELNLVCQYRKQVNYYVEKVLSDLKNVLRGRVLVLGTEEFMHPAIHVAAAIADSNLCESVKTHSTTRSPIIPSTDEGYPLRNRSVCASVYEHGRTTYLYNLDCYDVVVLTTDAPDERNYNDICNALASAGNRMIYIFNWRR
ncbi:MAG: hypothetical protein HFH14_00955 [Lachnospiraceae bacterium]|nr:hypothetical protein [Lachnospiraceae bacterium]